MSGPKIVDIRVLQAQRERQLRLLRERIAYQRKQWERSRQRLQDAINELADQADGQTVKTMQAAVQQIEQRFQSWPDDTDLEQLLQLSEAQLRFIEQETQELKEQLTRQLADARHGQRSLQLAIADAASRLERAGLGTERDELLAQATAGALEAALDRLNAAAVEVGDGALAAATTELVGSIKTEKIEAGPSMDAAGERVGRLLVQLELLGESSQIAAVGFAFKSQWDH
jgi:DNA repair exonuclease SbcCD ATPase subunit